MKVFIGPFRHWIGPYQVADYIFFWHESWPSDELEQRWDYRLKNKFIDLMVDSWFNDFLMWVDSKKKRKIDIRIDKYDTWGMDHTLALLIVPMLKQLNATKHGAPYVDDEDVPEELRSTAAPILTQEDLDNGGTDANHFKRWDWVMSEMQWAFEQVVDEDADEKFYIEKAEPTGMFDKFDIDQEGMNAWRERKKNGFRLFGKYYEALWD